LQFLNVRSLQDNNPVVHHRLLNYLANVISNAQPAKKILSTIRMMKRALYSFILQRYRQEKK
jgi:hypothetical protein